MRKKKTTEDFIIQANEIHNYKYEYSKVEYVNNKTKVCIICPTHGEFWQAPDKHINRKQGCPKCKGYNRTTEDIIKEFNKAHNNKYDYSKIEYKRWDVKVCIICPEHGEFWQTPNAHLYGHGCPICGGHMKSNTEEFIKKANIINDNKYNYTKVKYVNNQTKVSVICPEHGEFKIRPNHHLRGIGCPKCSNKYHMTTNEYIEKARAVHGDKYDYTQTVYLNNKSNVYIKCNVHGGFWQNAKHHLNGCGCPVCKQSHLEEATAKALKENNVDYIQEKRFEWMGRQRLDFYLPKYNIAIECQGIQHFKPTKFGGEKEANDFFKMVIENDKRKKMLCEQNGVDIYYINFDEDVTNKIKIILEKL